MHRLRLEGSWTEVRISFMLYTINVSLHTHGQDNTVAVWDMFSPMDIFLRKVLEGHTESVYAVDLDETHLCTSLRLNKRTELSDNTSSILWNWKLETGSNLTYLIQPSPSQGFIHSTTISAMCLLSPLELDHTPYQSQFNCYKQVCTLE